MSEGIEFERWDGEKTQVGCVQCCKCKNYWWVQHLTIEPPGFCCYCGSKFERVDSVSAEEMKGHQIL